MLQGMTTTMMMMKVMKMTSRTRKKRRRRSYHRAQKGGRSLSTTLRPNVVRGCDRHSVDQAPSDHLSGAD